LELNNVSTKGEGAETNLNNIDLEICQGEIVGVAGVSGNGQRELGDVILGTIKCTVGTKYLYGKNVTNYTIRQMRNSGISFVPENPLTMAAIPYLTVLENMAVTNSRLYSRYGGLKMDWEAVKADTENAMRDYEFSFPLYIPAKSLSGGNLQRMVIVREMSHEPQLIVALYLTRGLDVQSTYAARQALAQARDSGTGVLLISEDLEELFNLSNRIIVLRDGRIVGQFHPSETDVFEVGHMMTGSREKNVANS
jgi:simple sugar transport system ATP-binding protein